MFVVRGVEVKVNIMYQVELEEIPNNIADLINKVKCSIEDNLPAKLNFSTNLLYKNENVSLVLQQITECRKLLMKFDQNLNDYSFILAQYQKTCGELYMAEKEAEQNCTQIAQDIEQLQEKKESNENGEINRNISTT